MFDGLMQLPRDSGPRRPTARERAEAERLEALISRRMRVTIGERLRERV